jgi:SAM-dependent methyltransferase
MTTQERTPGGRETTVTAETRQRSIVAKTLDGLHKVGPLGTTRYACVFLGDRFHRVPGCRALFSSADRGLTRLQHHFDGRFDREYGTVTSGRIAIEDLTIVSPDLDEAVWYEPMSITIFRAIMDTLAVDLARFTFVDFGSGMGRVLLLASDYGFKRIIGVEFAPELHEIATNNVKVYESRVGRRTGTETVCEDATRFSIPQGPLVLFFFSPFVGRVMARVIANISESYAADPRPVVLIFHGNNPRSIELFEALGFSKTELDLPPDRTRFIDYRSLVFTSPRALETGTSEGDARPGATGRTRA